MYTETNFKTKKALKEAVASGVAVRVYQPGPFGPGVKDGPACIEGPHYPQAHSFYASCRIEAGQIVPGSVK
jgi:hypothetical protein